jgi:hypothetical protein
MINTDFDLVTPLKKLFRRKRKPDNDNEKNESKQVR